jgi:hypothetical protein
MGKALPDLALASWRHHENLAREMVTADKRAPGPDDIARARAVRHCSPGRSRAMHFLAWAESLAGRGARHVQLVHCVQTPEDAIGLRTPQTLGAAAARSPRFGFEVLATARQGRPTAERRIAATPFPLGGRPVLRRHDCAETRDPEGIGGAEAAAATGLLQGPCLCLSRCRVSSAPARGLCRVEAGVPLS